MPASRASVIHAADCAAKAKTLSAQGERCVWLGGAPPDSDCAVAFSGGTFWAGKVKDTAPPRSSVLSHANAHRVGGRLRLRRRGGGSGQSAHGVT
jgi:hypothetical protein